jgi:hypothetical protein
LGDPASDIRRTLLRGGTFRSGSGGTEASPAGYTFAAAADRPPRAPLGAGAGAPLLAAGPGSLLHFSHQPEPFSSLQPCNRSTHPTQKCARKAEQWRSVSPWLPALATPGAMSAHVGFSSLGAAHSSASARSGMSAPGPGGTGALGGLRSPGGMIPSLNFGSILAGREDVTPGQYDVTADDGRGLSLLHLPPQRHCLLTSPTKSRHNR